MQKKSMLDLHRISAEEFKQVEKIPVAVVLDDVRSEMNVGSVFRTADAFVIERIALCGITATPPKHEIHKTALGAEDSVEWAHHKTALEAVEQLREQGYTICSIEQVHGSVSLEDFTIDPRKKYALVLGNEVKGVSQVVVDASDCCIEIPQLGTKHSLNIACSAAIVMWHFFNALKVKRC
ncbi:MAG: RNA methyltransferase [Muribaculaceae bacterium]|nr:RNA methyltransferase [Muribaculaceae bacterium]